jgi:hypothetical protein
LTKQEKWAKFVSDFTSEVAIDLNSDISRDIGLELTLKERYFTEIAEKLLHECGLYVNESC